MPHRDPLALAGRGRPQRYVVGEPRGVSVSPLAVLVQVDAEVRSQCFHQLDIRISMTNDSHVIDSLADRFSPSA